MAVHYRRNCKVCIQGRKDPKLRHRIYTVKYKRETTDDTYRGIARDYGGLFSDVALTNHAKKHVYTPQTTEGLYVKERRVAKLQAEVAKELELKIDHSNATAPKEDFERVWDSVISEGLDRFKKSDVAVTVNQLLAATKLKADYHTKRRGQDAEIIKTMMRSASGAKEQDGLGSDSSAGAGRPDSVHRAVVGDAAA
jgi:hypothetical protein